MFSGVGGSGSNFINTVFDDAAENSITTGTAPFTGTFQPTGTALDPGWPHGRHARTPDPALWVPGVWTLQLTNTETGASGMLDNWSLNITPVITVTPVSPGRTAAATTFTIGFPQQQLSGTYTIQLGPNILDDVRRRGCDTNQNAGLDVLRGQDQNGPTTTVQYTASRPAQGRSRRRSARRRAR